MYTLDVFFLGVLILNAVGLWFNFLPQVLMKTKCSSNHRRAGRPRQDPESERKGVNHGWFVAVDGQSAKIMGMTPLDKPENNKTAIELLKGLVDVYPKIRTVVYDRACSFMQSAKKVPKLKKGEDLCRGQVSRVQALEEVSCFTSGTSETGASHPWSEHQCSRANICVAEEVLQVSQQHGCGLARIPASGVLQNAQPVGWQ